MTTPGKRRSRRQSSGRVRAAIGLGAVLGAGVVGTQAFWTDAVTVTGASFSTGSIELLVNNQASSADFSTINLTGMVPGNSTAAVLTVKNAGTAMLKYTATSTATNGDGKNLAGALVVKITGAATTTGSAPSKTCAGTTLSGTGTSLNGSVVSTGRLLDVGASETLCVQVTLPATAASSLQSATTNATLNVTGTSDLS